MKGYEGMNPKYYKGLQSVASCQPEDLLEWDKLFQGIYWLYPAACITTCYLYCLQPYDAKLVL